MGVRQVVSFSLFQPLFAQTNQLFIVSENFDSFKSVRVGPVVPLWGFTSLAVVPGSDGDILALKVLETADEQRTVLTVFDQRGNFKIDPPFMPVADDIK